MTQKQDSDADAVIAGMVSSALAMAIIPTVNTIPFIGAMGAGVVGIGVIYGVRLTKDEAWKLVRQFMRGAGSATAVVFGGSKVIALVMATTGVGYGAAVALDAAISTGTAYAIGMAAKHYFKNDRNMQIAQEKYKEALRHKSGKES